MKSAVLALLVTATATSAFTAPSMTFAVGKKAAPKAKAAKTVAVAKPAAKKVVAKVAPKVVAKKVVAKTVAVTKPVVKKVVKPVVKKVVKAVVKPVVKKVVAVKKVVKPVVKKVVAKKVVAKKVVVKKVVAKLAPKKVSKVVLKPIAKSSRKSGVVASTAIPGEFAPAMLDGSMIGDVGFDPCFLATKADSVAPYFNGIFAGNAPVDGLTWYREAELMHGRICMIATLGFIAPGWGTIPGAEGIDFTQTNPLLAFDTVPGPALFQIGAFMSALEFKRISYISSKGASYVAGDSQAWGQGEGRWNPFSFDYTPAEYAEKQLQEVKHARLAMIGFLGVVFQATASGEGVVEQWSGAFSIPDYAAKAGYFLPEGI